MHNTNTNINSGQPNMIVAASKIEESFLVKIKRLSENGMLPTMAHPKDACYDLYATVNTTIIPNEIVLIPTDLSIELPDNFEAQIRPRSGLALKHGITVLNAPGTLDKNFTGNVSIILINLGRESYEVKFGDRIAQIAFRKIDNVYFEEVEKIGETDRGNDGFGSSGK